MLWNAYFFHSFSLDIFFLCFVMTMSADDQQL